MCSSPGKTISPAGMFLSHMRFCVEGWSVAGGEIAFHRHQHVYCCTCSVQMFGESHRPWDFMDVASDTPRSSNLTVKAQLLKTRSQEQPFWVQWAPMLTWVRERCMWYLGSGGQSSDAFLYAPWGSSGLYKNQVHLIKVRTVFYQPRMDAIPSLPHLLSVCHTPSFSLLSTHLY